jgi:hypothetical protein
MAISCDDEMPTTDVRVPVANVAVVVENLIMERKTAAESAALQMPQLRRFDSSKFPRISISDYLQRLKKFAHFDTAFVIALIYIDRLLAADSNFAVTQRNVHRLLIACTTVAEKYFSDVFYSNTYYASVGGVCLEELNQLEVTLLCALMWRLGVSREEYDAKQRELTAAVVAVSSTSEAEWIVVNDTGSKKRLVDAHSESSVDASTVSGSQSVSDSDESMDSSSEDA